MRLEVNDAERDRDEESSMKKKLSCEIRESYNKNTEINDEEDMDKKK